MFDLAGELGDVLAKWAEPLALVAYHFYESLSVCHQTILEGLLELALDVILFVTMRAEAGALGVRGGGMVPATPRIPVQVGRQGGGRQENLDAWVVVAPERLIGIINLNKDDGEKMCCRGGGLQDPG